MNALNEYYAALERLKANKPTTLPKGSAINNDTVALEAGRKRGSIKKSRHAALVEAIELAAQQAGQGEGLLRGQFRSRLPHPQPDGAGAAGGADAAEMSVGGAPGAPGGRACGRGTAGAGPPCPPGMACVAGSGTARGGRSIGVAFIAICGGIGGVMPRFAGSMLSGCTGISGGVVPGAAVGIGPI